MPRTAQKTLSSSAGGKREALKKAITPALDDGLSTCNSKLPGDLSTINVPVSVEHPDVPDVTDAEEDESVKEDDDDDATVADNTYESDLEKDDEDEIDAEEEEDELEAGSDVEDDLAEEEDEIEDVADDDAPGDTNTVVEPDDDNATTFIGTADNIEGDEPAEAEYTDYSMGKRDTKMNAAEAQARLVSKCRNMLGLKKKSKRKPAIESELDFDNAYLPDDR